MIRASQWHFDLKLGMTGCAADESTEAIQHVLCIFWLMQDRGNFSKRMINLQERWSMTAWCIKSSQTEASLRALFDKTSEHFQNSYEGSECYTLYTRHWVFSSSGSPVCNLHKNSRRFLNQICISEWACETTGVDGSKRQLPGIFVKLSCIQPQSKHIIICQALRYHVKKYIWHPWRAFLSQPKALHQTTLAALSVEKSNSSSQ